MHVKQSQEPKRKVTSPHSSRGSFAIQTWHVISSPCIMARWAGGGCLVTCHHVQVRSKTRGCYIPRSSTATTSGVRDPRDDCPEPYFCCLTRHARDQSYPGLSSGPGSALGSGVNRNRTVRHMCYFPCACAPSVLKSLACRTTGSCKTCQEDCAYKKE